MPAWLIAIISSLGIPALKLVLKVLEQKYPNLAPLIDKILALIGQGYTCNEINDHLCQIQK